MACQAIADYGETIELVAFKKAFKKRPKASAAAKSEVMRLTHHWHSGDPERIRVSKEPLPAKFEPLGNAPVHHTFDIECMSYGSPHNLPLGMANQRRWDALPKSVVKKFRAVMYDRDPIEISVGGRPGRTPKARQRREGASRRFTAARQP